MKNLLRNSLLALLIGGATAAYAAPSMSVTVSDPGGKVAYKGNTSGNGTFATGALAPGDYTVQFRGGAKKGETYAIVVSAGKQKVTANSVDGSQLGGAGVAMKVKVGKGLNITGQVADATKVMASGNTKVKVVNGKRYFWVSGGGLGSNLGGRWVEEGTAEARAVSTMSQQSLQDVRDRGNQPAIGN
jgi:hypothetical protein